MLKWWEAKIASFFSLSLKKKKKQLKLTSPPPLIKSLVLVSSYLTMFLFSVHRSVNELYVDDPDKDSGGKIEVSLNISLPNLHCDCEYLHNIYIYIHFFALHLLFVCFLFHIVHGLLFTVCFSPYQTVSYPQCLII